MNPMTTSIKISSLNVSRALFCGAVVLTFGMLAQQRANAANQTWNGGGANGTWSTVGDWVGGTAAPGANSGTTNTDTATFNAAIANGWGTSGTPVVIDSGRNIQSVLFDTAAGNYFIGSTGGSSLLLTNGGAIQILSTFTSTSGTETVNAPLVIEGAGGAYSFTNNAANGTGAGAGTLNFGGAISGGAAGATVLTINGSNTNANTVSGIISNGSATSVAVTKSGAGTWTLSGANTFTGGLTIQAGTVMTANSPKALGGNGTGAVTLGNSTGSAAATLEVYNQFWANPITVQANASNPTLTIANVSGAGNNPQYTGLITLNNSVQMTALGGGGVISTGTITGNGGITTSGLVTLTGSNNYTGTTTVSAGMLLFGNEVSLYNNNTTGGWTAANLIVASGATAAFNVGGSGQFTSSDLDTLIALGGATTGFQSGSVIGLDTPNAGNFTYASNIANPNGGANVLGLTKLGADGLTLAGANTYTGATTVTSGTLQFAKEVSLYNNTPASWTAANLVVASGATAAFNVGGPGEFTSSDLGTLIALGGASNGFESGAVIGLDTTNASGGNFTYASNIANPNGGANVLGLTKIGANSLTLAGANTYTGATTVTSGTLNLTGTLNGTNTTVNGGALNESSTGVIAGAGNTFTLTSGAAPLAGANTYTGATTVTSGTLSLTGTLNGTAIAVNGGAFNESSTGVIAGANSFTVSNSVAAATLSGANTFTGNTTINSGVLTLSNALAAQNSLVNLNSASANALAFGTGITAVTLGGLDNTTNEALTNAGSGAVALTVGNNNTTPSNPYSGIFSGNGSVVKVGTGNWTLTGSNTFTGGLTISAGEVTLGIATTATNVVAATIGTGPLTFNNGAIFNVVSTGAVTFGNNLQTWNGNFSYAGGESITFGTGAITLGAAATNFTLTVNNNVTYGGAIGQTTAGSNFTKAGGGNLTLNGANTFTGALTSSVGGTLTIGGGNSYTGATLANNASITVNNGSGTIANSSSYTVQNGTLTLDFTPNTSNQAKLKTTSPISLANNAAFALVGSFNYSPSETVGAITFDQGTDTITVGAHSQTNTTLLAASLTRLDGATGLVRGLNLNQSLAGTGSGGTEIIVTNSNSLGTMVGATTLVNGGTNDATTTVKIVPWLIGGNSTSDAGSNFVTYDNTLGLRVLNATEAVTLTAGYTTAGSHDNVNAGTNVTLTNASGIAVNSLLFNSATTNALNSTNSNPLTVDSGAVALVTSSATTIGSGFSSLALGNGEGIFHITQGTLTVNTPIGVTSSGGITKADGGTLQIGSAANTFTGTTTVNAGTLTFTAGVNNALNGSTGTALQVNGGTFNLNTTTQTITTLGLANGGTVSGASSTLNLGGNVTYNGSANGNAGGAISVATLNLNGARTFNVGHSLAAPTDLNVTSAIGDGTGTGSIIKTGAGLLVLGSANTYSGGTTLSSGTLQLGNATALGAVTGPLAVNAGTLDLHDNSVTVGLLSGSNGAVITSNASGAIVLTASSTLSGTFGGQIQNGSGTVGLTQAGAGTLTLSNSNTYTGATIVSAGTLLVSGSLSGSSAVSATTGGILALQGGTIDTLGTTTIANASTLTGNGTVGTLSILAGGTFAPGVVGSSGSGGVITTASNSTFATGAAFGLQISGTGAGQYGQLAAGGQTVTLSGSTQLSINLATGYTPVAGDTFTLILGAGGAVAQDFYSGSTLLTQSASTFTADGFNWQISYDGALGNDATVTNNVDLEVLGAVPEPSTWAMLLGGAGLLGIWRRNRRLTK